MKKDELFTSKTMHKLSFTYIDTCYPDYLSDHHNRDGELLVGIDWNEDITDRQVVEDIVSEVLGSTDESLWKHLPNDDELVRVILTQVVSDEVLGTDFSMNGVDCPEEMMIYGYFKWPSDQENKSEVTDYATKNYSHLDPCYEGVDRI